MSELQIDPDLTDAIARQRTVEHIVATLQQLPDGWVARRGAPRQRATSAASGLIGADGMWNFQVGYWIWSGRQEAADRLIRLPEADKVFDGFVGVWSSWGWIDSVRPGSPRRRSAQGHTPDGYRFDIRRGIHGGVSTNWTSPYFRSAGPARGGVPPGKITKDGPQYRQTPLQD